MSPHDEQTLLFLRYMRFIFILLGSCSMLALYVAFKDAINKKKSLRSLWWLSPIVFGVPAALIFFVTQLSHIK